ncbi:hypothetical protein C8R42DRAFT_713752 [Lentinula raphanica]|nr:hypothetical protein C8R42DRAFT_713752 [Lentinula raphanica]
MEGHIRRQLLHSEKVITKLYQAFTPLYLHIQVSPTSFQPQENGYAPLIHMRLFNSHPERLEYIYFNAVLLLRAVSRMTPYLMQYVYFQGVTQEEIGGPDRTSRKCLFGKISTFRNCPLWGKVQTAGLATAMKILYEFDDIVFKFSESIQAATQFMSLAQPVRASIAERIDIKNVRGGGLGADSLETRPRAPYIRIAEAERLVDGAIRLLATMGVRSLESLTQWRSQISEAETHTTKIEF